MTSINREMVPNFFLGRAGAPGALAGALGAPCAPRAQPGVTENFWGRPGAPWALRGAPGTICRPSAPFVLRRGPRMCDAAGSCSACRWPWRPRVPLHRHGVQVHREVARRAAAATWPRCACCRAAAGERSSLVMARCCHAGPGPAVAAGGPLHVSPAGSGWHASLPLVLLRLLRRPFAGLLLARAAAWWWHAAALLALVCSACCSGLVVSAAGLRGVRPAGWESPAAAARLVPVLLTLLRGCCARAPQAGAPLTHPGPRPPSPCGACRQAHACPHRMLPATATAPGHT